MSKLPRDIVDHYILKYVNTNSNVNTLIRAFRTYTDEYHSNTRIRIKIVLIGISPKEKYVTQAGTRMILPHAGCVYTTSHDMIQDDTWALSIERDDQKKPIGVINYYVK